MAVSVTSMKQHLEAFIKHVDELMPGDENDVDGFGKEFLSFSQQRMKVRQESIANKTKNKFPAAEALKDVNLKKNRFKDIAPYDYTRVKLDKKEGVPGSDYINANFIKGIHGKPTYIASQGPLPHTTTDFWRMLWQYNIQVVIMVCQEFEMDRPRCHRYWPNKDNETLRFDDISVTLTEEQHPDSDDHFVFREIRAVCGETTRTIHQLQFLAWPDRFVPSEYAHVIDLLAKAREFQKDDLPPIVVHCSAGCGRTGSLLVIDYVWNLLKAKKITASFSLFDIINTMRTQRPSIVQSEEQYYFVHKAIVFLFKEHLKLLNPHFGDNTNTTYDNQIYTNVQVKDGTIAYTTMSATSRRIIENTVEELGALLKREPRRLASNPSEKPVVSEKPNITKKPRIGSGSKSSVNTSDGPAVSPNTSDGGPKSEKVIASYEDVIVQPTSEDSAKDRMANRPPIAVPDIPSAGGEAEVIYSEVSANTEKEETKDNEYEYADPNRTGKWSLQHIALAAGKISAEGPYEYVESVSHSHFEPAIDYTSDENYETDSDPGPEIPAKSTDHDGKSTGKLETGITKMSKILSSSFRGHRLLAGSHNCSDKEDRDKRKHDIHQTHKRLPLPSASSNEPVLTWVFNKEIIHHGQDISFPNRVKKPAGHRSMKNLTRC